MVSTQQKLELAEELLEGIETRAMRGQPLILKATRLARVLGSEGLQRLLRWELHGYPEGDDAAEDMLVWTGRKGSEVELTRFVGHGFLPSHAACSA